MKLRFNFQKVTFFENIFRLFMLIHRESFCVRIDINCQTIYISNSNTNVFPIVNRHNDDKCSTVSKTVAGNSFYEIFVIQKCLQSFQM